MTSAAVEVCSQEHCSSPLNGGFTRFRCLLNPDRSLHPASGPAVAHVCVACLWTKVSGTHSAYSTSSSAFQRQMRRELATDATEAQNMLKLKPNTPNLKMRRGNGLHSTHSAEKHRARLVLVIVHLFLGRSPSPTHTRDF